MGAQMSVDVAYGVAIDLEASNVHWDELPNQGAVASLGVGQYGGPKDYFLVISETWKSIESGERTIVQPYRAADEPYLTWDAMLVAKAEELKIPLVGQPGWVFAVDEN